MELLMIEILKLQSLFLLKCKLSHRAVDKIFIENDGIQLRHYKNTSH